MAKSMKKKLVAALIVGNEAARYLKQVLMHLQTYVDGLVILDDGSTDGTEQICRTQPKLVSFFKRPVSGFVTDASLVRRQLWEMTADIAPEWILALEADEIMEDGIRTELPRLLNQNRFDAVHFPVCHLWGNPQYIRVDKWWAPRKNYELLLFRHFPGVSCHPTPWHGRYPIETLNYPARYSHVRLRHYGWANPKAAKAQGNPGTNPIGTWGLYNDGNPTLKPWQ